MYIYMNFKNWLPVLAFDSERGEIGQIPSLKGVIVGCGRAISG